ncbi:MAG: Crp/Fnr family transcriptional regulator [Gemmatimonadetes bacterium]|nr:Crp/Fnr family transcriptional regulator [Gemmatimonadota bacterium]
MSIPSSDFLKAIPLFRHLGEEELLALAGLLRESVLAKGTVIVTQGDPGDTLFLIADGQVKVAVFGEDGREVILSVLTEGRFFGEMALLDDEPRSAHVIAMTDASLWQLRRDDFRSRLRASPDLAIAMLRELSRRLRRADETIASLALLDVNGRIAHLLLGMAREEGGNRITRKMTHATIAQMVGASRETVSRTMRSLAIRGVIVMNRKEIVIQDPDQLRTAARRG